MPQEARMSFIEMGSYVVHAKLPELGAGEVLSAEKGAVRIRFASGERSFSMDFASRHLTVTAEPPAKPAATKAPKAKRAKKA
jgi:hypothetical protein